MHGAVHPRVGFLPKPLLGELVEMGPALEGAVADEDVMLHVADVALVLALGLGAGRPTGAWPEAVVAGQIRGWNWTWTSPPRRCAMTADF
jgi:hypothetical protein